VISSTDADAGIGQWGGRHHASKTSSPSLSSSTGRALLAAEGVGGAMDLEVGMGDGAINPVIPCCLTAPDPADIPKAERLATASESKGSGSPFHSSVNGGGGVDHSSSRLTSSRETLDREWYGATDHPVHGRDRDRDMTVTASPALSTTTEDVLDTEPTVVFKESWKQKEARLRPLSAVGHLRGWRLLPVIVKSGDDLRQEQLASQVIFQMHHILKQGRVGCWLRPYNIIATSPDSGLIEAIADTVSLDVLRRRDSRYVNLKDFFQRFFGPPDSPAYEKARNNFMKSLAGYCIVCYLLQLKDRHNGNILLHKNGHIIHIDFGFMLAKTPGGNMGFEKAPFKLTSEFVDLLNGAHSPLFHKFR